MLIFLITLLAATSVCFLMLRISSKLEDDDKNVTTVKRKIAFPLSASAVLWLLWCGIRQYWPPISISEHWLSVVVALSSMIFAIAASIRAFTSPITMRLGIGLLCLFVGLISLLGVVLSIPVS